MQDNKPVGPPFPPPDQDALLELSSIVGNYVERRCPGIGIAMLMVSARGIDTVSNMEPRIQVAAMRTLADRMDEGSPDQQIDLPGIGPNATH